MRGLDSLIQPVIDLIQPAERITIFTPFGVRFWDAVFDRPVTDGLRVTAWQQDRPAATRTAFLTMGGVYAFQDLPGLHDVKYPRSDPLLDASPPTSWPLVVEVSDALGRFLPVAFVVDIPFRGVFPTGLQSDSTGNPIPGFYLFSAPTRPVSANLGVLRVQLEEYDDWGPRHPAAFGLIELELPGALKVYGMADDRGCAAVLFPYPVFPPSSPLPLSPALPSSMAQPRWAVTLRVRYAPAGRTQAPGSSLPDFATIITQARAAIWPSLPPSPNQPVDELQDELIFGQDLLIRTQGQSTLLISPVGSPL